jgi:hypothetical protein
MKPDIRRRGLITTVDYGPRKKKVTYRRRQPSVHVREGSRIVKTIHFQPLHQRIAHKIRRAYRKFVYYLKFTLIVGSAAGFACIVLVAVIDSSAEAKYEVMTVNEPKYIHKTCNLCNAQRPVILKKIATCESGDTPHPKHINPRDVGRYGINLDAWGDKAKELGINVHTDQGNYDMATWILNNRGTDDWKYSRPCWSKLVVK